MRVNNEQIANISLSVLFSVTLGLNKCFLVAGTTMMVQDIPITTDNVKILNCINKPAHIWT